MPKFGDFNKASKDVLGDDVYSYDTNLSIKTKVAGIAIKSKLDSNSQKIGISKYSPVDGLTISKLEAGNSGKIVAEATISNVMDGLKFGLNYEGTSSGDTKKADIKIDYSGDGIISNTKINPLKGTFTESVAFQYEDLWLGATGSFDTNSSEHSGLELGLYHATNSANLSCNLNVSGESITTTYQKQFDADTTVAGKFSYAGDAGSLDFGLRRKLDSSTTFSAKTNVASGNSSLPLEFGLDTKLSDSVAFNAGYATSLSNLGADKVGFQFTVDV